MKDLQKEARKFYDDVIEASNIPKEHYENEIIELMQDFGGYYYSMCVESERLKAKIELCNDALNWSNESDETSNRLITLLSRYQNRLKEIEKTNL